MLKIAFQSIPAGSFLMGATSDLFTNEQPQRRVSLTRSFEISSCPVTQEQYRKVMKKSRNSVDQDWDPEPSHFDGDECPVDSVSWLDCVEFCRRLSERPESVSKGLVYRLPTEAEWEHACRANTTTKFSFGDDDRELILHGWFEQNARGRTQTVGQLRANPWGLHDMHGNIWEWCSDWYADYPHLEQDIDPEGPESGSLRSIRGGCWYLFPDYCRASSRYRYHDQFRSAHVGFRIVRSVRKVAL